MLRKIKIFKKTLMGDKSLDILTEEMNLFINDKQVISVTTSQSNNLLIVVILYDAINDESRRNQVKGSVKEL